MKIVSETAAAAIYSGRFTGAVQLSMLDEAPDETRPDTALGTFVDGATTNWHRHPGGQLLWVVSGTARVGTARDASRTLAPGTLVVADPDERHWHGAAPGADTVVLSLTWGATVWEDTPAP
jgi:quercetin dioxygenase-like cupin family protein